MQDAFFFSRLTRSRQVIIGGLLAAGTEEIKRLMVLCYRSALRQHFQTDVLYWNSGTLRKFVPSCHCTQGAITTCGLDMPTMCRTHYVVLQLIIISYSLA